MEEQFGDGKGKASILISHTHWDHVQGLPFFSPLYRAGNQIHIFARQRDMHLEAVFSPAARRAVLPGPAVGDARRHAVPRADRGRAVRDRRREGHVRAAQPPVDRDRVSRRRRSAPRSSTAPTPRRSPTSCSAASSSTRAVARRPLPPPTSPTSSRRCAPAWSRSREGADLLIYDTQFTPEEYQLRPHWGHSRPDDAIEIAREAEGQAAVPVPPRAAAHRRRERRDPRARTARSSQRRTTVRRCVSAYEGLEIPLGDE